MKTIVSSLNNQELQVVQAFSSVNLPEEIFKSSNMKDLIDGMISDQGAVENNARKLERLRQEKKDGNFFSNMLNNRNDHIQDAQIDLGRSIGSLTQKSSQLLIINTAISKVLNHQQQILLQQQNLLEQQTHELKNQNLKILDQQNALSQQQKEINAANQGLLEAKGLTNEQAQKLVGCVVRVTEAEKRLDLSNQELRNTFEQRHADLDQSLQMRYQSVLEKTNAQDEVTQHLQEDITQLGTKQQDILATVNQNAKVVSESINEIEIKQRNFQGEQAQALEILRDSVKVDLQHFAVKMEGQEVALKAVTAQMLLLQKAQYKS